MSEKLYSLISKILGIPIQQINDDSGPGNLSSWTSFKSYVLLYELESTFDVKFSIDEIMDVKNVSDIKRHLKNHGKSFD
ncbi:acyl carrier protein [Nitrosarchaeum sp.]|uniref:acyl carrier protein n=1 Tax=Nitrosarchaeum sp. TaxID=2026886 RepID=UPI00247BD9A5|nr:acyl carrier protein [Nitrosarchaeum sp.]MCV0411895.1 acyl carrier protein [Nitrosarchaeum sp.]